MNELNEQRVSLKFCDELGKSASKTFDMLNAAYGNKML